MGKPNMFPALTSVLLTGTLLVGCATPPSSIDVENASSITIAQIQAQPDSGNGKTVLWGGTIAGLVNGEASTDLLVVSRPLSGNARPAQSDSSTGRFLARIDGFLEPEVYVKGREVSVTGKLDGIAVLPVGKTQYNYPVVIVDGMHLWKKRATLPAGYPYRGYSVNSHYHHPAYWWDDHRHGTQVGIYGQFNWRGK